MRLKPLAHLLMTASTFIMIASGCQNSSSPQKSMTVFNQSLDGLQGAQDEVNEIKNFQQDDYKIYKVRGVGSFYVDNREDLIKRGLRQGNMWEPEFVAIMKKQIQPGTTAVDVGAHVGSHTLSMSKFVGEQGKVISFEPLKKLYTELVHNVTLNDRHNVTAYRCALGSTFQEIEMNPALPDNEGATAIGQGGDPAPMITLDSLNLENVSFIKIDVENYEYEVLKGAEKTIRKYHPYMIIEIMGNSYVPVANRSESVDKTVKLIEDMGYDVKFIEGSWSDWLATPKQG